MVEKSHAHQPRRYFVITAILLVIYGVCYVLFLSDEKVNSDILKKDYNAFKLKLLIETKIKNQKMKRKVEAELMEREPKISNLGDIQKTQKPLMSTDSKVMNLGDSQYTEKLPGKVLMTMDSEMLNSDDTQERKKPIGKALITTLEPTVVKTKILPKKATLNKNDNIFKVTTLKPTKHPSKAPKLTTVKFTQTDKSRPIDRKSRKMKHSTTPATTSKSRPSCPHPTLPVKSGVQNTDQITCKPNQLSQSACQYVTKNYPYEFNKNKCGNGKEELTICTFDVKNVKFKCNYKACGKNFTGKIFIHIFDDQTGWYETQKPGYKGTPLLEKAVLKFAKRPRIAQDFLFLSCNNVPNRTQILHYDSKHFNVVPTDAKREEKLNINVVWLDSLSRRHFYRSLPRTIERIAEINKNKTNGAEILDFELMQSVHGHTHQSLHAFFDARVLSKHLSESQKNEIPPNINNLLSHMKWSGYEVLYQEDMCYKGYWGFNQIVEGFKEWKRIKKGMGKLAIDETGLMFASCKMIETALKNDDLNIFNTVKKVCYNGQTMNTYYLRYITQKLLKTTSNLFTVSQLNYPHDGAGDRVQGMDNDLADFFTEMSNLKNTITFVFADHGNTYTNYIYAEVDGRYEQHHPHFFTILPEKVIKRLGYETVNALRHNRLRLVSLIDLHHTIKRLADRNYPKKGILEMVPANRTCGDLELSTPNFCVCQDWDSPMMNKTLYWPFVEFAVGNINNMISDVSPESRCKRLVPQRYENLISRKKGANIELSMDVVTKPGVGSTNNEERFSFQVKYNSDKTLGNFQTELVAHNRVSKYGGYKVCSDTEEKDLNLCICNLGKNGKRLKSSPKLMKMLDLYPVRTDYIYRIQNDKFYLREEITHIDENHIGLLRRIVYENKKEKTGVLNDHRSTTFELINYSSDRTYDVKIVFTDFENMKPMNDGECKGIARPNSMRYLCTIALSRLSGNGGLKYEVEFTLI